METQIISLANPEGNRWYVPFKIIITFDKLSTINNVTISVDFGFTSFLFLLYCRQYKVTQQHLLAAHLAAPQQQKVGMVVTVVTVGIVVIPRDFQGDPLDILAIRQQKQPLRQRLTLAVAGDTETEGAVIVDNTRIRSG